MVDDDEDLLPIVPAAFAELKPKRARSEQVELKTYTFEGLKGEHVLVRANGFVYRGVLIGADEGELYLRTEMRYLVLPLADVTAITREPRR